MIDEENWPFICTIPALVNYMHSSFIQTTGRNSAI